MNLPDATRERLMEKYRSVTLERLDRLNNVFIQLQTTPDDVPLAQELLREIHTLKGEARMMGLNPISLVAHRTEDLLQRAQEAHFSRTSDVHALVLAGYDLIAELVRTAEPAQAEELAASFAQRVSAYLHGDPQAPPAPITVPDNSSFHDVVPVNAGSKAPSTAPVAQLLPQRRNSIRVDTQKIEQITDLTGDLVLGQTRLENALHDLTDVVDDWRRTLAALRRQGRLGQRVMNQQQIAQLVTQLSSKLSSVDEVNHRLMRTREDVFSARVLLDDLEDRVRELRLIPLSTLFDRMPRAVHDIAQEQGKRVRVVISGNDIAVDADVLDKLGEPLVHLLRNCVDHGIETPTQRLALAKPEEGVIALRALQKGTHVEISVSDDGQGMDFAKLVETAVFRGFVSAREAASVSRATAMSWIFKPGFSTRELVTDLSGRGVGLDAVWQQVSALGGTITYETVSGEGTTFTLLAPVSTVLSRALVLSVNDCLFAVNSEAVLMALDLDERELQTQNGGRVVRVGGERIGVSDLANVFSGTTTAAREGRLNILVVQQHGSKRAFVVDTLIGERQVIQRKLDPFCENLPWVHGTALLDGGGLALLLDVSALLNEGAAPRAAAVIPVLGDAPMVLVVDDSEMTRDMVVSLLKARGYRVREAVDGIDAIAKAAEEIPSLILTDLEMPRCNGFDLLRLVRADKRLANVPVVVFSTLGADSDKQRASALGANAYIVKTNFREDELAGVVSRYIHNVR